MTAPVKASSCLLVVPASVLTMLSKFQENSDKNFGGKTIRIVKPDRVDTHGKEVGGCFAWLDVVSAVLPGQVIGINADIVPSLGFVNNGYGRPLAVVHPSDMEEIFTRHMEKASVLAIQRVEGGVGGVAVQTTGGDSSLVLPKDCFVVPSKNGSLYGKKIKDIHMGGFSLQNTRVDNRVIRFRKHDHKVVMPELLVVLGKYESYQNANRAVLNMISNKNDKVTDLATLEIDTTLSDTGNPMVLMHFPDVLTLFNRMGIRPVNDVTAQVTANVTAAMDPKGMGVHMGEHAAPLPMAPVPEIATKDELRELESVLTKVLVDSSEKHYSAVKILSKNHYSALITVHDSALNVIVKKAEQIIQYVDEKMVAVDEKVVQLEKRLALLETPKKSKKPKTKQRSTVSPNISFANGRYSWRKTICKKLGYKGAYKTMHEAKQGLQQFCQEQLKPAAAMED